MKKIIFHVGAPKTGTSAIQAFLSINRDMLLEQDIYYPWPESADTIAAGLCSGNLFTKIIKLSKEQKAKAENTDTAIKSNFIPAVLEATKDSPTNCILFSGEFMMWKPDFVTQALKELSKQYQLKIIACIRDPYDHFISAWKQLVKRGYSLYLNEHLKNQIDQKWLLMNKISTFIDSGLPITLIPYDNHKSNIIPTFLSSLNSKLHIQTIAKFEEKQNLSLSLSQAVLAVMSTRLLNDSRLNAALCDTYVRSAKHPPVKDPYLRSIDQLIRQHCRAEILSVNTLLSDGSKIRIDTKNSAEDSSIKFSSGDVEILFKVLAQIQKLKKPAQIPPSLVKVGLPVDFDPIEYLIRNPDVRKSGQNPIKHFLYHGRHEGRRHKSSHEDDL